MEEHTTKGQKKAIMLIACEFALCFATALPKICFLVL
jgi:hypothetical protein